MKIKNLKAIEILDSRGKPTVRTFITLEDGTVASSSVPSGASTGSHEAVELRDNDKSRYQGLGVLKAVSNVNNIIAKKIIGLEADPREIDKVMIDLDGTPNKSVLGANAILSVSQALVRALSISKKIPLWKFINEYYFERSPAFPQLMVNVVNGGRHASWNFDIQEFMIVPKTNKPGMAVKVAAEIFHQLGKNLKAKNLSTLVGDEGGYSPLLSSNAQVFETLIEAAHDAGYQNDVDFNLAIDAAASEFFKDGKYEFKKEGKMLSGDELIAYYKQVMEKYKILSFEDPFSEFDWDSFKKFTATEKETVIVGDDIYTTDPKLIIKGIAEKASNAVLIKLNQIGSVTETVEAIQTAQKASWKVAVSHRSGETEDSFMADLAYAAGAEFIKTGSMSRSERLAKYNRLIEIENGL